MGLGVADIAEPTSINNITLTTLGAKAISTGDWSAYDTFRAQSNFELNIPFDRWVLADVYFEENPQDAPYRDKHSFYWIYLEWYRLQLEHDVKVRLQVEHNVEVHLETFPHLLDELLLHFRQSAKKGYIQGLDNPWN